MTGGVSIRELRENIITGRSVRLASFELAALLEAVEAVNRLTVGDGVCLVCGAFDMEAKTDHFTGCPMARFRFDTEEARQ